MSDMLISPFGDMRASSLHLPHYTDFTSSAATQPLSITPRHHYAPIDAQWKISAAMYIDCDIPFPTTCRRLRAIIALLVSGDAALSLCANVLQRKTMHGSIAHISRVHRISWTPETRLTRIFLMMAEYILDENASKEKMDICHRH